MMADYDCPKCGESHRSMTDSDGYELANCPRRGTILVASPESST